MANRNNRQLVLKPQDLYVLLALVARGEADFTYAGLASQTGLALSAVHGSLKRAEVARLLMFEARQPKVLRPQLREFMLGGAKYAFPAVWGAMSRGVPTGYAAPPLNESIAPSSDPAPVWASAAGSARGLSLAPLYPGVPEAALRDPRLYALLALFDAVRSGMARERNIAAELLSDTLK